MGPVGRAFRSEQRSVLLIDEIDKADLEFPNDLLHELDAMSFLVHETNETVRATHRPVVIITSNNEKELPDAFLRRCVFHWIAFPGRELMRDIVAVHHPRIEDQLIAQAIERFYAIRELPELRKRPSTSELVDWIAALARAGVDAEALRAKVPFLGVLLKSERDEDAVRKRLDREDKLRTRYT
jgi:MoxR-like ATPase